MSTPKTLQELKEDRQISLQECYEKHNAVLDIFQGALIANIHPLTEDDMSSSQGLRRARSNIQILKNIYGLGLEENPDQQDPLAHGRIHTFVTFIWQGVARNREVVPIRIAGSRVTSVISEWEKAQEHFQTADRLYRLALVDHPVWGVNSRYSDGTKLRAR